MQGGLALTPSSVVAGAGRVWRRTDRERRLAAAAALAVILSLFAPWFHDTVVARGVTGLRTLQQGSSGWQALPAAAVVAVLVALAVLGLLVARAARGDHRALITSP